MPFLTHNALKITERTIPIDRLPDCFDGFRIVQFSDLHFYERTDQAYYNLVVDTVNARLPDAVVLTGDVIHYGGAYVGLAGDFLRRIEAADTGVKLAILGNHDYYDDANSASISNMLTHSGYQLLKNTHHAVERNEHRLWFAGLDDLWYGTPDISKTLAAVPSRQETTIMLAHNPLLFDPVALGQDWQVDLVISGHTHAGHVYIPILGPIYRKIFRMKYRYGLYEKNGCRLHVTSGVGSAAFYLKKQRIGFPRFRFNTHPEIAVLTLRCPSSSRT